MYQEFQGCSKTCHRTPRFLGSRLRTLVLNTIVSCRFILFHFIQSSSLCFWPNRLPVVIPKRLMIEVLVLSLTRRILKWANSFLAPSPQPPASWEKEQEECRVIAHTALAPLSPGAPTRQQQQHSVLSFLPSIIPYLLPHKKVRLDTHSPLGGGGFSSRTISWGSPNPEPGLFG